MGTFSLVVFSFQPQLYKAGKVEDRKTIHLLNTSKTNFDDRRGLGKPLCLEFFVYISKHGQGQEKVSKTPANISSITFLSDGSSEKVINFCLNKPKKVF